MLFSFGLFMDLGLDVLWSVDVDWGDGLVYMMFIINIIGSFGS